MNVDPTVISQTTQLASVNQPGIAQATRFEQIFAKATGDQQKSTAIDGGAVLTNMLNPLIELNNKSEQLGVEALAATNNDVKPSELLMLTMQTHEFMFECQLTSNVANRSSDGVQQLFKQQS